MAWVLSEAEVLYDIKLVQKIVFEDEDEDDPSPAQVQESLVRLRDMLMSRIPCMKISLPSQHTGATLFFILHSSFILHASYLRRLTLWKLLCDCWSDQLPWTKMWIWFSKSSNRNCSTSRLILFLRDEISFNTVIFSFFIKLWTKPLMKCFLFQKICSSLHMRWLSFIPIYIQFKSKFSWTT